MTEQNTSHPDIKRLVRIERTVKFAIEVDVTSYINEDNTQMSDEEITAYEVMKVKDWGACITDVYESGPFASDGDKSCISQVTFVETVVLERCPTCGSPAANLHPATQSEGEVTNVCLDTFHAKEVGRVNAAPA